MDNIKNVLLSGLIFAITIPGVLAEPPDSSTQNILFFGDSITAGYGIDKDAAFPALIQNKIDSLGWNYSVINGGLSGETSAGGVRRINWMMQKKVDVMVLELGGNDGLRGIDPAETRKNLVQIIEKARKKNPCMRILLAGMEVPPNLGKTYRENFKNIYASVSREKDVALIPFILEGVGGVDSLNQSDGIHPTEEGHEIIAQTVWQYLKPLLQPKQAIKC